VAGVNGVVYHESITEFRQFACERAPPPAMLCSGVGHRQGVTNAAKITNVIALGRTENLLPQEQ
jgi:hypothetical protein